MIRFQAPAMRRAGFPDGMGGGDVTSDSHFGKAELSRSPAEKSKLAEFPAKTTLEIWRRRPFSGVFGRAPSPAGPISMAKPLRMDEALSHTGGPQSSPGHRPWKGPAIQWA